MSRFTLLTRKSEPILWDFGSAASSIINCIVHGLANARAPAFLCCAAAVMPPEMGRAERRREK